MSQELEFHFEQFFAFMKSFDAVKDLLGKEERKLEAKKICYLGSLHCRLYPLEKAIVGRACRALAMEEGVSDYVGKEVYGL